MIELKEWLPFLFLHSVASSAILSHSPSSESTSESHTSPPSEVMRPPSKVASKARAASVSKRIGCVAQSLTRGSLLWLRSRLGQSDHSEEGFLFSTIFVNNPGKWRQFI